MEMKEVGSRRGACPWQPPLDAPLLPYYALFEKNLLRFITLFGTFGKIWEIKFSSLPAGGAPTTIPVPVPPLVDSWGGGGWGGVCSGASERVSLGLMAEDPPS